MYLHRMKISIMLYQLVSIHIHVTSILLTNYTVSSFTWSGSCCHYHNFAGGGVPVYMCYTRNLLLEKEKSFQVRIRDKGIRGSLFGLQGLGGGVRGS